MPRWLNQSKQADFSYPHNGKEPNKIKPPSCYIKSWLVKAKIIHVNQAGPNYTVIYFDSVFEGSPMDGLRLSVVHNCHAK